MTVIATTAPVHVEPCIMCAPHYTSTNHSRLCSRCFGSLLLAQYPLLAGHYKRIADLPGVKEYLASPQRLEKVNGNGLG